MSDQAVALRNAQLKVTSGKNMTEDAWMTRWCQSNWGELLQPAPMSLSILGTLMLLVQGIDDFDLRVESKGDDGVKFEWKFVRAPDSFKASLIQMVTDGGEAFVNAHKNMEHIQTMAGQVPQAVKDLIKMLLDASPRIIARDFPKLLEKLSTIANECSQAGKACQEDFRTLCGLAGELAVGSQRKLGSTEKAINKNAIDIQVLEGSKKAQEEMLSTSKKSLENCARDFTSAQDLFKDASQNVPSGWSIVGMNLAESAMNVAVSAANAYISLAVTQKQLVMMGANVLADKARGDTKDKNQGGTGNNTTNSGSTGTNPETNLNAPANKQATTDPGIAQIPMTLSYATAMQDLVCGGPGGKPNWDYITTHDASKHTGASFVQASLKSQLKTLDVTKDQDFSARLLMEVKKLVELVDFIVQAGTNSTDDAVLAAKLPEIKDEIERLNILRQSASHATLSTGNIAAPLYTSDAKPSDGKASSAAVDAAKNNLSQCRSNLEGARATYEHVNDQVVKQMGDLKLMIDDMSRMDLQNQGLKKMVPILIKAVGSFTTIHSNITMLVRFFDSIAGLIADVMAPSCKELSTNLGNAAEDTLGGLGLERYQRNIIHQQALLVSQVSMLASKISGTYCTVSDKYILPNQAEIGKMLLRIRDAQGNLLPTEVAKAQKLLAQQATQSNQGIADLIKADQATFMNSISARLNTLDEQTKGLMSPETPAYLREGNVKYLEAVATTTQAAAENNPQFKTTDQIQKQIDSVHKADIDDVM
ncbi:hypothetical protein M408DRAFT_329779 [Serendipita vermifera MAFF 305830]|uniref:Uncharacterized protein n=1 Tax=Serendipita vermifera MAFF 305830 TaxID=933852 RepID=A0A0C3B8Q0_SERVB|nr:hypothetical protein M408DRAFT_329779 [Serendipita vermifera MAFF 305830]